MKHELTNALHNDIMLATHFTSITPLAFVTGVA
jgi:hypothetical protein